jgi:hypothetical protein
MMNSPDIIAASTKVIDELLAMTVEEFKTMWDEYEKSIPPRCEPDTCQGQCQGMGWCYTCEDFRGEAPDDEMEDLMG